MPTGGKRRGVFQLREMRLGSRHVQRDRRGLEDLSCSREGKVMQGWAKAGLIGGGEETRHNAAIRLFCLNRTQSGRRQDSGARRGIGVERKQLVTHL